MKQGGFSRLLVPSSALLLLICTVACGGGSNAQFRIMNASPGESSINVTLGSTSLATGLGYGTATSYTSIPSGSPTLDIVPNGGTTTLINEAVTLNSGTTYTVLADNYSSDIGLTILTDNNAAPTSGNVNLRIVNAAPGLGTADVYVERHRFGIWGRFFLSLPRGR